MEEQKLNELAILLYENYCIAVGGIAFNGDKLPTGAEFFADESKKKQADAWRSAAAAANTFFEVNDQCIMDGTMWDAKKELPEPTEFKLMSQVATGTTESTSLDGCPFHYCDGKVKCEGKCKYT